MTADHSSTDVVCVISVRIKQPLRGQLEEAARSSFRSLSSEIAMRVASTFKSERATEA